MKDNSGRVGCAETGPSSLRSPEPASGLGPSGDDPARDERAWPLCGYAPGGYSGRCHKCGQLFEGDKRSLECLECAVRSARYLLERGSAIEAAAWSLTETLKAWSEFGGPPLPPRVSEALGKLNDVREESP